MKEKDIHVLNWENFSQCTNSSGHTINKGLIFEDLIERLLIAMFPNQTWRRTAETHDGKRDFVYPSDEHLPDQKWAECKNYNSNLSLNIIAPTLIMGTIENIESIFFFSYSPLNDNAIEGLLRYSKKTQKEIKIYDGNVLESLICEFHKLHDIADFFPNTDFQKAYEILDNKKARIIKSVKDIYGNQINPLHIFELGESFYINLILQNFSHKKMNYKIYIKQRGENFLKCNESVQNYSLSFANVKEYSLLCQTLKPGNMDYQIRVYNLDTKKEKILKKRIKVNDEPYLFWTGTNALRILEQCYQHLLNYVQNPLLIVSGSGMGKSTLINILLQDIRIQSKYKVLKINLSLSRNCCIKNLLTSVIDLQGTNDTPAEQIEDENVAVSFLINNYAESNERMSDILLNFYHNSQPYLFVIDDIQEISRTYISLFKTLSSMAQSRNIPLYFVCALAEDKCTLDDLFSRLSIDVMQQVRCNIIKLAKFEKKDIITFIKHKFGIPQIEKYFFDFDREVRPLDMQYFCKELKRQRIIAPIPNSRTYQILDPFKFRDMVQKIPYVHISLKELCRSMNQGDVPEYLLKYLFITDTLSFNLQNNYKEIISRFISWCILKDKDGEISFYHEEIKNYIENNFVFSEEDYSDIFFEKGINNVAKAFCALMIIDRLKNAPNFLKAFFCSNYNIQKKESRLQLCWLIFDKLDLLAKHFLTNQALNFVRFNFQLLNDEQGHSSFYRFLKHIADSAIRYHWDMDIESVEDMSHFIKKFFDRSLSTYRYRDCFTYFEKYKEIFLNIKNISNSRRYYWLSYYANRVAIALDRETLPLSDEPQNVSDMYSLSEEYCNNTTAEYKLQLQILVDNFYRHYIYRHNLTKEIVLYYHDNLIKIGEKIHTRSILLDYHILLLKYLEFKIAGEEHSQDFLKDFRSKIKCTRNESSSKFYILKLYILEIYTLIDLRNYVAANKILAEAYEFVLLKDMRSYMYKLSYIKAHLYIFQEKMVNVSETCRLIELALEQLMSQYNNSLNDLKREIFLLIRLVQFTNTYKPGRIQTLILPFSFELQSLVEEVVNSLYDEDLLNMKSYFLFKNISFPNI